jgi:general secretion pathway protein E
MMMLSPALRGLISATLDLGGFGQAALAEGLRPLRISASTQVARGLTTVQEILSVLPPVEGFDDAPPLTTTATSQT